MMLKNKIENKIMYNILMVERKTVIPFVYMAIILIVLDLITTVVAMKLGLSEKNIITLAIMGEFGSSHGLLVSIIGKIILMILPFIAYQFVYKELNTFFIGIPLRNIYWTLYTIIALITIMTTFVTDVSNTMIIMTVIKR